MHRPRKRFGQHFLCDQGIIHRIVSALMPELSDHLVEIGPGQGALTLPVLKSVKQLEVIELDRDLVPALLERCQRAGTLQVHEADVLEFDFAKLKKDDRLLRVFGNLPYNISTPLLFHLLTYAAIIDDMLFMLQKEVAERLAAEPNSEHYGRLSVMVQYHCQVDLLFDVPPGAFYPPPQVQSSIVRLLPFHQHPHPVHDYALFEAIVKEAFGQRRKTLRNSLKNRVPAEVWEQLHLSSSLRPENLSVNDFVAISNQIGKAP
jgi:16S rRNA (adenine1518-N6/adenine1519-N6)-dimethyltransferase